MLRLALVFLLVIASRCGAQATRPTTNPDEIRRGVRMGLSAEERTREVYQQIIRKVEPDGLGHIERLPQYLALFQREFVREPRMFAYSMVINGSAIEGYFEFIEQRNALGELLKQLGLRAVENRTVMLPEAALGEKAFGRVKSDTWLHDRSEGKGENLTECLAGEAIFLLKDGAPRLLAHARSGYVGWIDADAIERISGSEFDGRMATKSDERIERAIAAGKTFLGTKYAWGGLTKDGIDCSGLTQTSYAAAGIRLPRDADMQSLCGDLVATRWHRSSMTRGDLMFFLSRRGNVSHVALYLGNNEFVEAGDGGVAVRSLDSADADYAKKRDDGFAFAKRVIE